MLAMSNQLSQSPFELIQSSVSSSVDELLSNTHSAGKLVFLDGALSDAQLLTAAIPEGYETIVLDSQTDGIQQISDVLAGYRDIESLHIVTDGDDGQIRLGNQDLTRSSIILYEDLLIEWTDSLTDTADVLLYGSNVAASESGQAFVDQLSFLTGIDFAASTDLTGHDGLQGDWDLEYAVGSIEAALPFTPGLIAPYTGSLSSNERIREGLLALYTFDSKTGDTVYDTSGVDVALDLTIEDVENVTWGEGTLTVDAETLIASSEAATKLHDNISDNKALTVEAWIASDNLNQSGPARIISLSENSRRRNFTLGQDDSQYNFRLRTTATGNNGSKVSLSTPTGAVETELTHVVYTWEETANVAKLYVDNVLASETEVDGRLTNWDEDFQFALSNELSGDRGWLGTFDLVAIYGQALDDSEVAQNYAAGPEGITLPPLSLPDVRDDVFGITQNTTDILLDVLSNDRALDAGELAIAAVSTPTQGGILTLDTDNTMIFYTPAPDFIGVETFIYSVSDELGNLNYGEVSLSVNPEAATGSVIFPEDAGVLNVLSFGAVPNDGLDDTEAIQAALDFAANDNRIVYLPEGIFLVSDRLDWPDGDSGATAHKRTILQGQSQAGSIIQLQDNAPGYQDSDDPKAVIWTGTAPAQRFRNAIRDLTVNTGSGNPGAVGVQFIANNQGGIWNVGIESGDGQGAIGLDMSYTDEIGPLYVDNLRVSGFDYGITTHWQTASITFENVFLENQNVLGWENDGQTVFVRNLNSVNTVPVLKNVQDSPSTVMLVDANLVNPGTPSDQAAILNEKTMFLRNVQTSGYSMSVNHEDKGRGNEPGVTDPYITEWLSHGEASLSLFDGSTTSLNLLPQATPDAPWDPLENWVSPVAFGGVPDDGQDDTAAIQAAIDSGATTVYLPNGDWDINGTLSLRSNIRRLVGTEARLSSEEGAVISFEEGSQPTVWLERLDMREDIDVVHAAERTLVLSNLRLSGRYSNTGTGDVFIEDVTGGPFYFKDQNVWARQINPETDTQVTDDEAKIVNDGGQLWILGLKTERAGTIVKTTNGGTTEVLGGFIFSTGRRKKDPAFVNIDSSLSLAGVVERNFNGRPFRVWVEETQDGVRRQLKPDELDRNPLFTGYQG